MRRAPLGLAALAVVLTARPAVAETLGIRPLGGDYESARTVGQGKLALEVGAWVPTFSTPSGVTLTDDDNAIFARWQQFPAWPAIRGLYGLADGHEVEAEIGPVVGGAYRRFFLRADAPWPHEYLQVLIQLGGGFHLASYKPMGYIRVPAIFEAGPFTLHVAGGGYYLFNNQPTVDVDLGLEYSIFERLQLGGLVKLRMDSTKITPTDGNWSFGGGLRYQLGARTVFQVDVNQDAGAPVVANVTPRPHIEFPFQSVTGTVGYYF